MSLGHDALLIDFPDEKSARLAADTFDELGYEPCLHESGRLHIHVRNEDLTSALEIMQSYGGTIVERAPADTAALTGLAYGMDAIPIPAHTVNEDWVDAYATGEPGIADADRGFLPDDESYDHFEAT